MPLSPNWINTPKGSQKWFHFRVSLILIGLVACLVLILLRLVQLQVFPNADLNSIAQRQFQKLSTVSQPRLAIFDRNREELAISIPASSLFARPRQISNKKRVAIQIARILGGTPEKWYQRMDVSKPFVWLQRHLSDDQAKRIARLNILGIYVQTESKRVYPNGPLASHVLGFTDIDGNGISGLELTLNEELLQKSSKHILQRDGRGTPSYVDSKYFRSDDGKTGVYITLDRRLQHVVEEELERAMEETGARTIMAIVMDPFTGEIFAMTQRPTFDPNTPGKSLPELFTNQMISYLFEPGSTMKVLLAAEAIETQLMQPSTLIHCENGSLQIGGSRIGEAEADHHFGLIPLEQIVALSSNVGAAKVAQKLGVERVQEAIDRFGLTRKTGIRLPGETTAPPKDDSFWVPLFLATVGFGQGIAVTPLQMVAAFAPFANGGYLVRPRILLRENLTDTGFEVSRVLSSNTVDKVKKILVSATEMKDATGRLARVSSIQVAGKTGTAQKYQEGGYNNQKYFSSFIGFLPAQRPELLVGVLVDEPKWPYYASKVAAPLFSRIAERSLQVLNRVPKLIVSKHSKKKPPKETALPKLISITSSSWLLPDLNGLSKREVIEVMEELASQLILSGYGFVKTQFPEPGAVVSLDSRIDIRFAP